MAKSKMTLKERVHELWYTENDLLRRTYLILFCVALLIPGIFFALIVALYSVFYIPVMTIMHGVLGYNSALRDIGTICELPLDIQMSFKQIWLTHWDRLS